jgi:hypothetical protein
MPTVMLSPKARKRVFWSFGASAMRTVNPHAAVLPCASTAVQVTGVAAPAGNGDPDGGEQPTVTGGAPPTALGTWYVTVTGPSFGEVRLMSAGQLS